MGRATLLLDLPHDLLGPVAVQVVDPHLGACSRELDADGAPDAPTTARHDRHPAGDEVRPVADRGHDASDLDDDRDDGRAPPGPLVDEPAEGPPGVAAE